MSLRLLELEARRGAARGTTNGATPVEVVATPDEGFVRVVRRISVINKDTVIATVRLKEFNGDATYVEIDNDELSVDERFFPIEGSDECNVVYGYSLTVELDDAVTTNELEWHASWVDVPVAT